MQHDSHCLRKSLPFCFLRLPRHEQSHSRMTQLLALQHYQSLLAESLDSFPTGQTITGDLNVFPVLTCSLLANSSACPFMAYSSRFCLLGSPMVTDGKTNQSRLVSDSGLPPGGSSHWSLRVSSSFLNGSAALPSCLCGACLKTQSIHLKKAITLGSQAIHCCSNTSQIF